MKRRNVAQRAERANRSVIAICVVVRLTEVDRCDRGARSAGRRSESRVCDEELPVAVRRIPDEVAGGTVERRARIYDLCLSAVRADPHDAARRLISGQERSVPVGRDPVETVEVGAALDNDSDRACIAIRFDRNAEYVAEFEFIT